MIPATIAMEIARAKDADIQEALAEAYEKKALPGNQVLAIRRIIEQRKVTGKGMDASRHAVAPRPKKRVTADSLVRAYRKETERQKLLVKRATLSQSRLLFVVNALRRLLADEHFVTLLRAEGTADAATAACRATRRFERLTMARTSEDGVRALASQCCRSRRCCR